MKKEDFDFMNDLNQAAHLKPAPGASLFLFVIAAFIGWVLLWISVAEVDERVRGTGQVMPSSALQVVQSLEGGIVSELMVKEGDFVKKGEVLLRIDDILFASEGRGIEAQMTALLARQVRLKAEADGTSFFMPEEIQEKMPDLAENEKKLFETRQQELKTSIDIIRDEVREAEANISEINASLSKFSRSRELLQQELDIATRLVERRAMPEIEKLRLERELNEVVGNIAAARQARESLQARLNSLNRREEERRSNFRSQALEELSEVEGRIASIRESLASAEDRVRRTELRAPVDGIVQRVHVRTVGGVIEPAARLVEIVPVEDDLLIRARINPSDIAFLRPGQEVRVSITAYDPLIYGSMTGHLERISADAVEERDEVFFEIDVRTEKNYLGTAETPLPIVPGMVSDVEVITGKRTILTYLIKPVLRLRDRAFTEG